MQLLTKICRKSESSQTFWGNNNLDGKHFWLWAKNISFGTPPLKAGNVYSSYAKKWLQLMCFGAWRPGLSVCY